MQAANLEIILSHREIELMALKHRQETVLRLSKVDRLFQRQSTA
jgi:hypothetical protein